MDQLYQEALISMEVALNALMRKVPEPVLVPFGDGYVYRYKEQTIHQAIVQKLARTISTLRAARILLESGFVQEQAALQRILDEFSEDVMFLSSALSKQEFTELHKRYLKAFYAEEFDAPGKPSAEKRDSPTRDKIRGYITNIAASAGPNQSNQIAVGRSISKAYSGYIHGASPQIMDMYEGSSARFHVAGMLGTSRYVDHRRDLKNYFFRGLASFAIAAKAFGEGDLYAQIKHHVDEFVARSGVGLL